LNPQQQREATTALENAERFCQTYVNLGIIFIFDQFRTANILFQVYLFCLFFFQLFLIVANQTIETFVLLSKHIVDPFLRDEVCVFVSCVFELGHVLSASAYVYISLNVCCSAIARQPIDGYDQL
jgi:hypothetical protein